MSKKKVIEIIVMYEKYKTVGTKPVMLSLVTKYHNEYKKRYPPEEPADKKDLHHQR